MNKELLSAIGMLCQISWLLRGLEHVEHLIYDVG